MPYMSSSDVNILEFLMANYSKVLYDVRTIFIRLFISNVLKSQMSWLAPDGIALIRNEWNILPIWFGLFIFDASFACIFTLFCKYWTFLPAKSWLIIYCSILMCFSSFDPRLNNIFNSSLVIVSVAIKFILLEL